MLVSAPLMPLKVDDESKDLTELLLLVLLSPPAEPDRLPPPVCVPLPGVLFLQYGDETRRVHITHELSSLDTLHALILHMFPQKLTAGMLKSPNTAILIKDEARNVFYELEDIRDIQDRSIIKIYRKEPIYASYPAAAHLANGDLRVRRGVPGGGRGQPGLF